MFGLFDNLDDPKKLMLLQMGLGLLGGAPGQNKNFGADLAHSGLLGLQGYGQAKQQQARLAEQQQIAEERKLRLEELQRARADREGLRGAFQQSMTPAQTMQPDPYEFDGMRGGPMPQPFTKPGGFDTQGFLGRAAPFMDPMQAVQFQQQIANANKPDLTAVAPGATLYDRKAQKPVFQAPEKTPDWKDPAYQAFHMRKALASRPSVDLKVNSYTPASEEAQKEFMKSSRATYDQLKQAPSAIANIQKAKSLVSGAKGFMGTGGETLLEATKFLNSRLGTKISVEGVQDAEEIRSRIFFNVMDNLKKMDAQPSQMQQIMMRDALGGLGTDPNALPKMLDAYSEVLADKVKVYNSEVSSAVERGVKFPYDPVIKMEKAPQLKKNMTATVRAREAIKRGANPEDVRARLREQGYDDSGI